MTSVETIAYQNLIVEPGAIRNKQHIVGDGAKSVGDIMKKVLTAGTVTAGAGNVGNGTSSAATVGTAGKLGTYILTCKASAFAVANIPVEACADGVDIADRPVFVAPAACEIVSVGILTKGAPEGTDDANTMVLLVEDDGSNAIVTKTYNTGAQPPTATFASLGALSATHKILIAGEKVLLSVTNGATSHSAAFDLVIVYKLAGAAGATPVFGVTDPAGTVLADLTVGTAYAGQIGLTISDGSTDFALGDTFTVAITDAGTVAEATGYDNVLAGVLLEASDSTSAATYPPMMVAGGKLKQGSINAPSGLTVAGFKEQLLAQLGIELVPATFVP